MIEKKLVEGENGKATRSISIIRLLLNDVEFKEKHRINCKAFSRLYKLDFITVILLILQKSVKSSQLMLNEFFKKWDNSILVTGSAFTQARRKLQPEAFIELNHKCVVDVFYANKDYQTFWGFRTVAIDGSKFHLPNSPSVCQEFGTINVSNGKGVLNQYGYGLASVMYDVMNKVVLDSVIAQARAYEVDLAIDHLQHTLKIDLLLFDRNYSSYRFLATLTKQGRNFVVRCSKGSFKIARNLFEEDIVASRIETLELGHDNQVKTLGLPKRIKVRFVSLRLSTGELEVLVTSLLDEEQYPTEKFQELYHRSEGIEGFYGLIKERLNLDNFSGKTALSVKQDFYATMFITGLESRRTQTADLQLAIKSESNKLNQTVNNMVSFNAIKNHTIELFLNSTPIEFILETLTGWFMMNPTYINREREVPRKKKSSRISLNYNKRRRKFCF